jgi:iron complex outermembrane receptor protein
VPGGNPELEAEKSVNGELNVHSEGGLFKNKDIRYELEASAFYGQVDNWILWQPTDKSYWEAQNIKSVEHSGMDASLILQKKFKKWKWKFQSSYQFVSAVNKGVVDESLDKQLIYTPKHMGNWMLRAHYKRLWVQANYTYTGIRYITTSNSSYLPSYDLINMSAGTEFITKKNKRFSVQLDVNNILGKEYMSVVYRAMPGASFQLSVKYLFE